MTKPEKPVVHVVFNMSAAGSLRHAFAQMGLRETVIGLPDDLSFGPIDPPAADPRARWMEDMLGLEGRPDLEQEAGLFWSRATGRDIAPVAWVCRQSAMEFAGFLEFISQVGDHPFRVVDITDVEFAPGPDRSELTPSRTVSFGHVPSDNIVRARLLERQAILTEQELRSYRGLWKRLRAENAPFRVVSDFGLQSAPITYFDKAIATHVTGDWRKCSHVVGKCLATLWDDGTYCGDLVLWSRVQALVDKGVFEMEGDGMRMRNSSVRLASGAV